MRQYLGEQGLGFHLKKRWASSVRVCDSSCLFNKQSRGSGYESDVPQAINRLFRPRRESRGQESLYQQTFSSNFNEAEDNLPAPKWSSQKRMDL
jgi:hypothetical protein